MPCKSPHPRVIEQGRRVFVSDNAGDGIAEFFHEGEAATRAPRAEALANARRFAASERMLAALESARELLTQYVRELLGSYCRVGSDGQPLRETLDPDEAENVEEIEETLDAISAAIKAARGE